MGKLTTKGGQVRDFFTGEVVGEVITLQDPRDLEKRNVANFRHLLLKGDNVQHFPRIGGSVVAAVEMVQAALKVKPIEKIHTSLNETRLQNVDLLIDRISITAKPGKIVMRTSHGDLAITLYTNKAPWTCYNLIHNADSFQNISILKLVPNLLLQSSVVPLKSKSSSLSLGGRDQRNKTIAFRRGCVALVQTDAKPSERFQFFIYLANQSLPEFDQSKHVIFGRVENVEALQAIEAVGGDEDGNPGTPISIKDVIIVEDPFKEEEKVKRPLNQVDIRSVIKRAKSSVNTSSTVGKYLKKN